MRGAIKSECSEFTKYNLLGANFVEAAEENNQKSMSMIFSDSLFSDYSCVNKVRELRFS